MSRIASDRPASARRVALAAAALALNAVVVVLSTSEPVGDVLLIAGVGLLPAALFAVRHRESTFRRLAALIAVAYCALAAAFIYPIGYLPAALCLFVAALVPAGGFRLPSPRRLVLGAAIVLVLLAALLVW